jgi:phytanoyl-CoA hydroxylase
MKSFIKRIKLIYSCYNFFHRKQLNHNMAAYKKLGIKKKYYSPVSSKDFEHLVTITTDDDIKTTPQIDTLLNSFSDDSKNSIAGFNENGFAIIKNFFSATEIDEINIEVENLLQDKKIKLSHGNKIMFAFHQSPAIKKAGLNKRLIQLLSYLLKRDITLFQSINFLHGSEQRTHSDSIHMTTFPLGNLIAVWVALEDINLGNGPLHYFEGSHKLPYYLNKDYGNEGNNWLLGKKTYTEYEEMIEGKIIQQQLNKKVFLAKKGDILIWHANLFHGGNPHLDKEKTRKSMVFHYFGKEVVCYHEITQRPALIDIE